MRIAVLGASGHTGRRVVEALRARGAEPLPLARSAGGPDASDRAAVERAIEGCDAMVNLAGPFLRTGLAPVEAAIARGVPYVDTTGEQAFMARVRERLDAKARDAGVAVVNAMAYEYALGDLAARRFFPEGGDALHVLYRSQASGSAGTKKSVLRVMGAPTLSYEGGRLTRVGSARWQRTFATKDGPRAGVSFAGGEVLTVPRHTPFRTVRTYFATKRAAQARALAPLARALLHGPLLAAAERLVDARHREPRNERARGEVHLVREPSGEHVVVSTPDPYLLTAHVAAEGAVRVAKLGRGGVLAPAEAFDARDFLEKIQAAVPGFGASPFPSLS
ncbi:MAG TPA: saccharopine dehydrogenase NADP-binding domain-containing protein [Candidatus Thermoplasmatota archaeon]|nr:saccharopine dehydrogenase NADP-binding domain-containing protein [Candidatus Thermoplasmatota archaeon]